MSSSSVITNPVKDPLLQDSGSSDSKKLQFRTNETEIQSNGDKGTVQEPQLKRYWARTLVVIFVPSIVTVWYCIIWVALVLGIEHDEAAKYRTFSGSLIYYSWFIIGVFGLSWSKYGLLGVEAAMLQSRFWSAPNLVALLEHSNSTWSSASGWWKAIRHREFHKLWCLLTLLSVLPFIAFPLSGLVFEISDGYLKTSANPYVIGQNQSTFETRAILLDIAAEAWKIGTSPTIPGFGIVYTSPGIDRSRHDCLKQVPNTLPLIESVPDMFLAPQADAPVSGKAWGLRVKYDCSIVRTASEFTVLSEKPVSIFSPVNERRRNPRPVVKLRTPSGYTIQIFNSSNTPENYNLWSYSEMGTSIPTTLAASYEERVYGQDVPRDISQSMVLEYALWQLQFRDYYDEINTTLPFNSTLGPVIEGMGSPFFMSENKTLVGNDTFFKIRGGETFTLLEPGGALAELNASITDLRDFFNLAELTDYRIPKSSEPILDVAAPIGVRCVISSGVGTATLDGVTSTFSDFERVDPEHAVTGTTAGIFGHLVQDMLAGTKFSNFIKPSHSPEALQHGSLYRYQGYIHSQALLRSIMLAYGLDAHALMYDTAAGSEEGWLHTNLTTSREGKILSIASLIPGHGTGYLVLVLFCIWSGVSAALGIVYGFRKRPSDTLDGYTMLRRGADMSENLREDDGIVSGQPFRDNKTLKELPGT